MLGRKLISPVETPPKKEGILDYRRLPRERKGQLVKMTSGFRSIIGAPHFRLMDARCEENETLRGYH